MLRRHFFLFSALVILALMVVAGGLKVMSRGKGGPAGPGGPATASAKGPSGRAGGGGPGGGAQVTAVTVKPQTFVDAIEVLGVAKGRQSVTLTAATTQLVQRVRFADGQSVARGAVLVELKDTEQNAGLEQAQARLIQADRAYKRYRTLGEQGWASKAAIDEYQAAYLSAQADVSAARARQNDRMIRAPFAGVVGLSDVAPGALVNPGAPIVTLDDISAIRVDFQVPERYLSQLREGQRLTAQTAAYPDEVIVGRIAKLDTRIDERTGALTVRAEFPNPARRLKPGMMLRVGISNGVRQGLGVPESAVSVQGSSAFVYVIQREGKRMIAQQNPVATGAREGGIVEIRDGVVAGDRLVADGLHKIQSGQPVKVITAPATATVAPSPASPRPAV